MFKLLSLACLIGTVIAQNVPNLDDLLEIFGDTNTNSGANNRECMLENGEIGECVTYYLCDGNNTIKTDGTGVIDLRFKPKVGSCPSYMDKCCALPNKRHPNNRITPQLQQPRQGCGNWNKNGVGFESIGDIDGESKFGEFPWTAAILRVLPENNGNTDDVAIYISGGSLIHPSVVLTIAHNLNTAMKLRVRTGEWDVQTTKEIYPYQDRDVAQIEVHENFNNNNLFFDIALLFLKSPVNMAPNVGVACLPPPGERAIGGTRCFATGWGKDKFGKAGLYQVILKKVEVPVVDRLKCQRDLRKTRLGCYFKLHTSFMCAGGEPDKDACRGDGGSPLVCHIEGEPDRLMQSGIVSWGIGCGQENVPGVYVDVAYLRNWIDQKIISHGYDPRVYTY